MIPLEEFLAAIGYETAHRSGACLRALRSPSHECTDEERATDPHCRGLDLPSVRASLLTEAVWLRSTDGSDRWAVLGILDERPDPDLVDHLLARVDADHARVFAPPSAVRSEPRAVGRPRRRTVVTVEVDPSSAAWIVEVLGPHLLREPPPPSVPLLVEVLAACAAADVSVTLTTASAHRCDWLTVTEAAARVHLSRRTVLRRIDDGTYRARLTAAGYLIDPRSL